MLTLYTVLNVSITPEVMDLERPSSKKDDMSSASKGKSPDRGSSATSIPFSTLKEGLVAGTHLRHIRNHVLALLQPLVTDTKVQQRLAQEPWSASKQGGPMDDDRAKLCSFTLILSLIDSLARSYRKSGAQADPAKGQVLATLIEKRAEALEARNKKLKLARSGVKKEEEEEAEEIQAGLSEADSARQTSRKYALHMRLPKGDVFSRPVELDQDTLDSLDTGHADLVSVAPESKSARQSLRRAHAQIAPTLGERSKPGDYRTRPTKAPKDEQSESIDSFKPVNFLRYGNYASFAPSFDSAGSTLSYTASSVLWRQKSLQRAAQLSIWGPQAYKDPALSGEKDSQAIPGPPKPFSEQVEEHESYDLETLDESLDPSIIASGLKQLEKDERISAQLEYNLILLKKLQEHQWERLRRSYCPAPPVKQEATKAGAAADTTEPKKAVEEVKPSTEENVIAELLLDSLSSLLAMQPQAVSSRDGKLLKAIPNRDTIAKFSQTIGAIDPALVGDAETGYWGTLDESLYSNASRTPHRRDGRPMVIRDNLTVKLTEESESRAIRSGASHGIARDRGKGMLERFASSRAYTKEDKHDIDPLAARPPSPDKPPGTTRNRSGTASGSTASPSRGAGSGRPSQSGPGSRFPSTPQPYPNGMSPRPPHNGGPMNARAQQTPQRGPPGHGSNASFAFRPPQSPYGYGASPGMPPPSQGHMMGTPQPFPSPGKQPPYGMHPPHGDPNWMHGRPPPMPQGGYYPVPHHNMPYPPGPQPGYGGPPGGPGGMPPQHQQFPGQQFSPFPVQNR